MNERRGGRRRRLLFVRSAVLEVHGRAHVVAVVDLALEGAYLSTRAPLASGDRAVLKLVPPRQGQEVSIPAEVIRRAETLNEADGRPPGVAIRFVGLDPAVRARIEEFVKEGFLPDPEPTPAEHIEYRLLDRPAIDAEELNRLGRDGWVLATVVPRPDGVQLVLYRVL